MRTLVFALVVTLTPLGLVSSARADAEAQAQALYGEGEAAYKAGKFDEALAAFMAAYDTSPVVGLLFNIGQCHRQLKHHDQAVDFFQRYLQQETDVPNRKEIEDLIAEEKALAGKAKAAGAPPTLGATPATGNPLASTASTEEHPGEPAFWQQPVFWGVAGGAALAVLVGSTVAVVVATQPPPAKPTGSLGTFDLRASP